MDTVTRSKLFAKPEVERLMATTKRLLRAALSELSFAELEEATLAIAGEVARGALEEELQELADGFGEAVVANGPRVPTA